MPPKQPDTASHLPLRPVEFAILLVLLGGDRHGYAIITEAERRWPDAGRMDTGTLYRALRRLTRAGLVAPTERRPSTDSGDERRRYFTVTAVGRNVAAAEARRLQGYLVVARERDLLPRTSGESR
jgi:DNA-binding PadR family transcriptional regulator